MQVLHNLLSSGTSCTTFIPLNVTIHNGCLFTRNVQCSIHLWLFQSLYGNLPMMVSFFAQWPLHSWKKKNHIWSLERAWYGWWIVRHRLGPVMLDSGQHDEEEDLNTNSNWTRKYIGTVMDQTPIVNFPTELLIWKQEVLQQEQWTVKNLGLNWASVRDFHKIVVNSATSPNNLFFLSLMKSHDVRFEHQPQWKRDFLVMPASLGCDKN